MFSIINKKVAMTDDKGPVPPTSTWSGLIVILIHFSCLPSGPFPRISPTKIFCASFVSPPQATYAALCNVHDFFTLTKAGCL